MQQCAAVGLHRAYSEQSLNSPYLVGRLDLADHLRNLAQGRQQLPCIADQFTQDLPWNQVPVSVASILLGCGELSEVTRGRLLTARSGFGAIREVPLTANVLGELHKAPPSYRELIDLCLLLLENRSPSVLLSLEGLFERYVTKLVERANCGQVEVQKTERYPCADPEAAPLLIRPDVQVVSQEQRIVIDAKWKVLREKPEDGDVHQIVAYAALTGATRSLLIYPGGKRKNYEYAIAGHVATRLWAQTLCVSGSLRRCLREARRLQQFLRTLAREKSEKSPR
jgi:5-methylcytosine-specific restriction endonuclease McrBC regulatory subunit McrC